MITGPQGTWFNDGTPMEKETPSLGCTRYECVTEYSDDLKHWDDNPSRRYCRSRGASAFNAARTVIEFPAPPRPPATDDTSGIKVGTVIYVYGVPFLVRSQRKINGQLTEMGLECVKPTHHHRAGTWVNNPPAPKATHPPQSGTMYKGG